MNVSVAFTKADENITSKDGILFEWDGGAEILYPPGALLSELGEPTAGDISVFWPDVELQALEDPKRADGTFSSYIVGGSVVFSNREEGISTTFPNGRIRLLPKCLVVVELPVAGNWTQTDSGVYRFGGSRIDVTMSKGKFRFGPVDVKVKQLTQRAGSVMREMGQECLS